MTSLLTLVANTELAPHIIASNYEIHVRIPAIDTQATRLRAMSIMISVSLSYVVRNDYFIQK